MVDGPVSERDASPRPDDAALFRCGAEAVFLGRTRAERCAELGELEALEYDAHREMAEAALSRIASEEAARCGCGFIGVRHAVGPVRLGEASVLVRVMAGHRAEAFDACRAVIDRLKREAPIWKREVWRRDGETAGSWRHDHALEREMDR